MQIYGIDLAKSKFDVSYPRFDSQGESLTPGHKVVRNTPSSIEKFLKKLPEDTALVAEHTGVYGELLHKLCDENNVRIAFVGGYVIHTYSSAPDRRKTDELDCSVLREFGERFPDKLRFSNLPPVEQRELRKLASHRERLVEARKEFYTAKTSEDESPTTCTLVNESFQHILDALNKDIDEVESRMLEIIREHEDLKHNYEIITSVKGIGMVTAIDIIINTRNFTRITTAREYASFAGTAPFEKSSGSSVNKGAHVSYIGCRRAKSLLYMCAETARRFNHDVGLYYARRTLMEHKHHFYVLNAIANKLLRVIFALVRKGTKFDPNYKSVDPRTINKN